MGGSQRQLLWFKSDLCCDWPDPSKPTIYSSCGFFPCRIDVWIIVNLWSATSIRWCYGDISNRLSWWPDDIFQWENMPPATRSHERLTPAPWKEALSDMRFRDHSISEFAHSISTKEKSTDCISLFHARAHCSHLVRATASNEIVERNLGTTVRKRSNTGFIPMQFNIYWKKFHLLKY